MPELKPEQREAIFHDEGNVLVSASAGSGKTFVMIERAIRLICDGKAKVKYSRRRLRKRLRAKCAKGLKRR